MMTKIEYENAPVSAKILSDGTRFYDFGRHAFAVLELIAEVEKDQVITLGVGEVLQGEALDHNPGESRIYQEETVTLHPGWNRHFMTMHHPGYNQGTLPIEPNVAPFRYAEVRGASAGKFQVIQHAYFGKFDDEAADFHCDNELLNRIWEFCKYSIKATTPFGIFIDGNRERQAYEGDTYINQLSYFVCTNDTEIPRATIERLFGFPTWPTEWQLAMIPILHDYLLYTGDFEFTEKYYEPLKTKLLLACVNAQNLLSVAQAPTNWTCPGFGPNIKIRDIIDWPQGERDGYELSEVNLVPNCWFYAALRRMSQLAQLLGHSADAAFYQDQAMTVRQAIRDTMLKNGKFVDNPDSTHTALHSDIFAVLSGVADEAEKPELLRHLQTRGMACSVFGAQFLLECCYDNHLADYALQLMTSKAKRSWYNMLQQGATITMEAWDNSFKANQDWNHPWGAAPGNIIVRHLAGIRPTAPGFTEFVVEPQPGNLQEFSVRTPTPHGAIVLNFKNGHGELTVPQGTTAHVRGQKLPAGVHQF